jgi:hypothetical protein
VKGLEEEYSSFVAFLLCMFTVGSFIYLLTMPLAVIIICYAAMTAAMYKICYGTYMSLNIQNADFNVYVAAFMCAAAWPLYFLFGACMFLQRALRKE